MGNNDYVCTLLRAEEMDWDTLEIEFEVVGNMTLGELQDPKSSTLSLHADKPPIRPVSCRLEHNDKKARIKGVLTYKPVPLNTDVGFRYGSSGYTKLVLKLGETDA